MTKQESLNKAAQEAGYNDYKDLEDAEGYLSDNDELIHRAMDIYAGEQYNQAIRDAANLANPSEYIECGFLHVETEAILKLLK